MFFWPASSPVVSKSMLVYMEAFTGYYYTLQVLPGRAGPQANPQTAAAAPSTAEPRSCSWSFWLSRAERDVGAV